MKRQSQRTLLLIGLFILSVWFVHSGHQGETLGRLKMPLQYPGYIMLVFAVLGCLGVNVWAGGPFDPNKDQD
jgi:hypothetical protein